MKVYRMKNSIRWKGGSLCHYSVVDIHKNIFAFYFSATIESRFVCLWGAQGGDGAQFIYVSICVECM